MRPDEAAVDDLAVDGFIDDLHDAQLSRTVGEQNAVAYLEILRDLGMCNGRGSRVARRTVVGAKRERGTGRQASLAAVELTESQLWARKVGHHGDAPACAVSGGAHRVDVRLVV